MHGNVEPFAQTLARIRRGRRNGPKPPVVVWTCRFCRAQYDSVTAAMVHTYQHKQTLVLINRWVRKDAS